MLDLKYVTVLNKQKMNENEQKYQQIVQVMVSIMFLKDVINELKNE